jgi:hypothetical protein
MSQLEQQLEQALNVCRGRSTRKLRCDPDLPTDILEALWDDPDNGLLPSATPLQVKDRCVVMRCDFAQGSFVLKRHSWGSTSRTARMLLREPTAVRCAAFASFLLAKGVPTPRPRLCLVQGFGPFSNRSYLLTDFVEGMSLFHYMRSQTLSPDSVRDLARQVAAIWDQLIALNISHNDLKAENFIVDKALRVWLIDLEKMRIHHDEAKLRLRHMKDVENFLHVRNWRAHPEASDVFRRHLLKTSIKDWLDDKDSEVHRLLHRGYSSSELSNRISVAIISDDSTTEQLLSKTIDSAKDIADEIVLIDPSHSNDLFVVWKTIEPHRSAHNHHLEQEEEPETAKPALVDRCALFDTGKSPANQDNDSEQLTKCIDHRTITGSTLRHPWVLVLRAGECATPDLVRQLSEHVVSQEECDAVRIPVDEYLFGHSTHRFRRSKFAPIRMFHQHRCQFTLKDGSPAVVANPGKTQTLTARILHHVSFRIEDYVTQMNRHTDQIAAELFQQGRRAHLLRSIAQASLRFVETYFWEGTFRSGWIGMQKATVVAAFVWIQEAKLWQLNREDRKQDEPGSRVTQNSTATKTDPTDRYNTHGYQLPSKSA